MERLPSTSPPAHIIIVLCALPCLQYENLTNAANTMGALRDVKRFLGIAKALPNDELPMANARHQTKQVGGGECRAVLHWFGLVDPSDAPQRRAAGGGCGAPDQAGGLRCAVQHCAALLWAGGSQCGAGKAAA